MSLDLLTGGASISNFNLFHEFFLFFPPPAPPLAPSALPTLASLHSLTPLSPFLFSFPFLTPDRVSAGRSAKFYLNNSLLTDDKIASHSKIPFHCLLSTEIYSFNLCGFLIKSLHGDTWTRKPFVSIYWI